MLRMGDNVTWIPHVVQNFVNSRNVALAHLQFEAALALAPGNDQPMPRCAGRTFNVTDAGPPIAFADIYEAGEHLSATRVRTKRQSPLALLLVAYAIEAWCLLLARLPFLTTVFGLREPSGPIHMLQPAVFGVSIHTIVDDTAAKKSIAEGGIGYEAGCTTLEGVCEQILNWNREHEGGREGEDLKVVPEGKIAKAALTVQGVAA